MGRHHHSARLGKVLVASRRTFHDCLATLCWGTKGTSAQSRREEHRRAGESCVDSKAVGLHGLVLTDKASLNGQPLRRRSTTLPFKTCAGIATSAACALVLMFRAVSETRHAVWLLFCCLRRAQPHDATFALLAVCVQRRVTNAVAEHELGGSMTALCELSWWWWR